MPAPKLSAILKRALTGCGSKPFDKLLLVLSAAFNGERQLRAIPLNRRGCFTWPKSAGVYVIRRKGRRRSVYVGAVGHIRAKGKKPSSGNFRHRSQRWTPYCFDNEHRQFRYGPKGRGAENKRCQLSKGYVDNIDFHSLEIFCFPVAANDRIAPAAVEALLLQMHVEQYGSLPEANQQF